MSTDSLRQRAARLVRERANLEKRLSAERSRVGKLGETIARQVRDAARKGASPSSRESALRRIAALERDRSNAEGKIADLSRKIGDVMTTMAQTQRQVEQEDAKERRRIADTDKRLQEKAVRHAKEITRELEHQVQLSSRVTPFRFPKPMKRIRVLFLAANPLDTGRLRLDAEHRLITERIRLSEHRDSVEIVSRWAVRTTDILQHLNEHKPRVVHFSGHGADGGTLSLEDASGHEKPVSVEAMAATLATTSDDLRVVVFNACFSAEQAEAAVAHVDVAIGMDAEVDDDAAATFAAQFYSAIGFGKSIRAAFDQAVAQLLLEGMTDAEVPRIFERVEGIAAELVLVEPQRTHSTLRTRPPL